MVMVTEASLHFQPPNKLTLGFLAFLSIADKKFPSDSPFSLIWIDAIG
jgi:hypothetical protein